MGIHWALLFHISTSFVCDLSWAPIAMGSDVANPRLAKGHLVSGSISVCFSSNSEVYYGF